MLKVKEHKQYIKWLIDDDLDEKHDRNTYLELDDPDWRKNVLLSEFLTIKTQTFVYGKFYEVELKELTSIRVYEEYINKWRIINRQQKLERICGQI